MNYVLRKKINNIFIAQINYEKKMNSLEIPLGNEIKDSLNEFKLDKNCQVGILVGTGKAFCAGGSLKEMSEGFNPLEAVEYIEQLNKIIKLIISIEKPIIACVNGAAIGAGASLALACDLIFAGKSAKFSFPFGKVGLIPDLGTSYFLPRAIGLHKAKELIFTNETLNADNAYQIGLVNKIFSDDTLISSTIKIAEKIASGPPIAISYSKSLLSKYAQLSLEEVLEYEKLIQSILFQSTDHKEGVKAFYENRIPKFYGK